MSRNSKLSQSMFIQPVFQENIRKDDFTNIVLKSHRYLSFIRNMDKLSAKDIQDISSKKYDLPKLQTVINCGNGKVLPEIVQMFYPGETKRIKTQPHTQKDINYNKQHLPRLQSNKKVQDILLTECAKKDSFFQFKKNKGKMLSNKKEKATVKTLPGSPPKQIKNLKLKLFSYSNHGSAPNKRSRKVKTQEQSTPFYNTMQSNRSEEQQNHNHFLNPESNKQIKNFQNILGQYQSAQRYNFPPLKLLKVLKCLDRSSEVLEKQMQQDIVKQEKINFHKKFDRILQNQQLTYKQHMIHFRQYNISRKRKN